jgi:ABC-type transport system substrate-binding protein
LAASSDRLHGRRREPHRVPWLVFGVDTALLVPVCETLLYERTNGELVPFLAESYKVDMENKQVVLTLRQGIKFTDGSDWNADVALWNLQNDKTANYLSTAVTDIVKLGDYEVALKFDTYAVDILSGLASHSNAIISKESYEKNGEEWAKENPVGTGPFMLKSYTHGSSIVYEKNPNYWQKGKPYLDGIEYNFIRDVMTQNVAMQSTGDQSIDVLIRRLLSRPQLSAKWASSSTQCRSAQSPSSRAVWTRIPRSASLKSGKPFLMLSTVTPSLPPELRRSDAGVPVCQ